MKLTKLSERLQKIADLIPRGARLADIGTDHAYIPAYLAQNGSIEYAVASDVIEGPLKHARNTVRETHTEGIVNIRLGNGLKTVSAGEVNAVVIAGMGGILISEILSGAPDVLERCGTVLLQPMTGIYELRKYLRGKFTIVKECIAKENEKLYLILSVRYGADACEATDEAYLYVGKYLFDHRPEHFNEYFEKIIGQLEKKSDGLRRSRGNANEKIEELEALLNDLCKLYNNGGMKNA